MPLDLDSLVAIDTHVHVEVDDHGHCALPQEFLDASAKYFKAGERTPTIDQIAKRYRSKRIAAVIFTVDAEHATGQRRITNEDVAAVRAGLAEFWEDETCHQRSQLQSL